MYRIPKYQRSYAWDNFEIEDFIKDLDNCYQARKVGTQINHFFGGVVSVETKVTGVVKQHEYELVDGQQRFATFVLLVSSIISIYKELLSEVQSSGDTANEKIIDNRIEKLTERYIEFEQEVNRQTEIVEVLRLSRADEQFFRDLIRQNTPSPTRESHEKLEYVFNELIKKIKSITAATIISDKLDNLEHIQLVIENDFSLIHIVTYDHKEAYRLFQVLNNRGKSLTEGDLLRAKTLELLEGFTSLQQSLELVWDDILKDSPKATENYLRWIYASYEGKRAGSNTLFDDFLEKFYSNPTLPLTQTQANSILSITKNIQKEISNARKISQGIWPFNSRAPITAWDRNRLTLLIRELRLTVTLPILLAAYKLGERRFAELTSILERFLFRYKIISNQHIGAAVKIFHQESTTIRSAPATYNLSTIKESLRTLQNSKANDSIFRNTLDNLNYKEGGGNKPIKYFIMTLEHYRRWYEGGGTGNPLCQDKTRIYDFTSTTIEHVYPRNAHGSVINASLEPLRNTIGNLTFMGPRDNGLRGNDDFATKKPIFAASSVRLNQLIGQNTNWSTTEVNQWRNELKNMACTIFTI